MKHKAIFFDRDDTLIKDTGYMYKTEDLNFYADTFDILKKLKEQGFLLFIVTNQSGIGRGLFSENDMHLFNNHMLKKLSEQGIEIKDIVFCPHPPEDKCDCRKPEPKLLNGLCEKYEIDKNLSYMVGDKDSDLNSGINAGMKSYKIEKGHLKDFYSNFF